MPALPRLCQNLDQLTEDLCDFIGTPLVLQITGGIHVNDALIHDAWGALPSEWTAYWDSFPDHRIAQRQLIDSIDEDAPACALTTATTTNRDGLPNAIPPPSHSLVEWLTSLKSVSLPRAQRQGPMLSLPEELVSPMRTKKINEVSIAAAYIHQVCQSSGISHVIDMGSGQGYLSVTLALLFPSLRILAIDGSESQVAGSEEFAAAVGVSDDRLQHLVRYVDGSGALADEMQAWAGGHRCMLVGLHACGRLSEHMIRYFDTCPFITQLAAVGCCYNHIAARSDRCPDGFPISERLRRRDVALSPTALMTGCQAPNNWERSDLTRESSSFSKKQFYRAVLEKLLFDEGIQLEHADDRPSWGIRKGDLASFEKFTRRAVHCLGIDQTRITKAAIMQYEERYRGYEGRVAILWTLSVLCCKAVESIIALDRYWFLVERGAREVDIVPIFDYKISPRNLMMVAEKK